MKSIKQIRKEAGTLDNLFDNLFEEYIVNSEEREFTESQVERLLNYMRGAYSKDCIKFYSDIYDVVKNHPRDDYSFLNN